MTRAPKTLVCLVGSLAMCGGVSGVTPDASANPYQEIVDRNVFGLKPPPPPPDPEANKPPPPKVILTGIMTIFGNKRALMKTAPTGKPGEPPKELSYIIAEGTRDGDLEVLAIDEKAGTVKINYAGVASTLNFEQNGVKLTGSAPAGPGGPPMAGGGISSPNPGPGGNPFVPGAGGFNKAIPTRTLRLPDGTGNGNPNAGGVGQPSPMGNLGNSGYQSRPVAEQRPISAEEQAILIEVERERNKDAVAKGLRAPLPMTDLTPPGSPGITPRGTPPGQAPQ